MLDNKMFETHKHSAVHGKYHVSDFVLRESYTPWG